MRSILALLFLLVLPLNLHAEESFVTRAEGLKLLWEPLKRAAEQTNETPFLDTSRERSDFLLLTFAKARGVVDDDASFFPDEPQIGRAHV